MGLTAKHWLGMAAALLLGLGAVLSAGAQDEEAPDDEEVLVDESAEAMEEEAEAAEEAEEEFAEEAFDEDDSVPPAVAARAEEAAIPIKPRPAEILPQAARGFLLDIERVDGGFVAVGERGNIVSSADGVQWNQANVPVRATLAAVHFPTKDVGYAVGHDAAIVATKDGGRTWALQFFQPELEQPLLDVHFVSAERGFAVGAYGLMLETHDGGRNWNEMDAPAMREPELHFNALVPLNNGDLFLIGEQGLLGLSTDRGATWSRIEAPYDSSFFGAVPLGERGAVVYALRGNVFTTDNVRSARWREVRTGSVATMFGGTRLPDGRVAMVGVNGVGFLMQPAGQVEPFRSDAGTVLSAAIPFESDLLTVGEDGVQVVSLQP